MKYILIALDAVVCAAGFAYFFFPLLAMPVFGVLWLALPSRRSTTAAFFYHLIENERVSVFFLTFIWLLVVWAR